MNKVEYAKKLFYLVSNNENVSGFKITDFYVFPPYWIQKTPVNYFCDIYGEKTISSHQHNLTPFMRAAYQH